MHVKGGHHCEKAKGAIAIGGHWEPDQQAAKPGCVVGGGTQGQARGGGERLGGGRTDVIGSRWEGVQSSGQARHGGGGSTS